MYILRPSLVIALLVGCAPEYGLGESPGSDGTGSDGPSTPGHHDPPEGGDSRDNPWGRLAPDEIPEFYFVVAWSDPAAEAPYSCWGEDLRYAMIDLRGHVIAEFTPPTIEDADADGLWQGYSQHRGFLPAGPGQFVAVTGNDYYYDADYCSGGGNTLWQGWRGDGVTQQATAVASGLWMEEGYATRLHQADRDVVHGTYGYNTLVSMQPEAPRDLMLWVADATCETSLGDLSAVDLEDATVEDAHYTATELLPPHVLDEGWLVAPFAAHANVDEEQRMGMLFGTDRYDCLGVSPQERWISAWNEADGQTWSHRVDDLPWPYDLEYSALDGGAALYLPQATEEGHPFRLLSRGSIVDGMLPEELVMPRAGALLDPQGPSLLTVSTREDGAGDQLSVVHNDRVVWTIDTLSVGLDRREVWIRDVMLLPSVPD